ncbi:MAG: hypothetical protein M3046_04800 [Actinomycetota bacterium]|nr:hypothetical protein [Actinomycetota bacterium]
MSVKSAAPSEHPLALLLRRPALDTSRADSERELEARLADLALGAHGLGGSEGLERQQFRKQTAERATDHQDPFECQPVGTWHVAR